MMTKAQRHNLITKLTTGFSEVIGDVCEDKFFQDNTTCIMIAAVDVLGAHFAIMKERTAPLDYMAIYNLIVHRHIPTAIEKYEAALKKEPKQ